MRANDAAVVNGSEFPDWMTPWDLRAALLDEFDFGIDLAANAENHVAPYWLGPNSNAEQISVAAALPNRENALEVAWSALAGEDPDTGKMSVNLSPGFLNPPFSRELKMSIDPWVRKCWAEARAGFTTVSILPHRPDTRWWRLTQHAQEIREIPHRVKFLLPPAAFEARNALRAASGKKALKGKLVKDGLREAIETSGAGFPTAVVIWRPQPGVIGPALPRRVLWDYLDRTKRAA